MNKQVFKWIPYHFRAKVFNILWLIGFPIHNHIDNECCPDFSCCFPDLYKPVYKRIKYIIKN